MAVTFSRPGLRKSQNEGRALKRILGLSTLFLLILGVTGCKQRQAAATPAAGMQALPVETVAVSMAPVPHGSDFTATIKSRRAATLQPQVNGRLIEIRVRSGDVVRSGEVLMQIDPQYQRSAVASAKATEQQKKAAYDYNVTEVERQRKLFEAGVTSRDSYDQAQQAFGNTKADYEAAVEMRKTQEEQLRYYTIEAPFDGVVGDIPVHVGDYVSPSTTLTTVDERRDLEAYIYIPTGRNGQVRKGLAVHLTDDSGNLLEKTEIYFISPEVDSSLQGILVKAPVHSPEVVRHAEIVKARIIWDTKPKAVVPVLAVTRLGGQTFVYVAQDQGGKYFARQRLITVGDTVGDDYEVLGGLNEGDKVIVSQTQFLVDGASVMPLPPVPAAAPHGEAARTTGN
jgi:RND family efflux transporter MFP subunit